MNFWQGEDTGRLQPTTKLESESKEQDFSEDKEDKQTTENWVYMYKSRKKDSDIVGLFICEVVETKESIETFWGFIYLFICE